MKVGCPSLADFARRVSETALTLAWLTVPYVCAIESRERAPAASTSGCIVRRAWTASGLAAALSGTDPADSEFPRVRAEWQICDAVVLVEQESRRQLS